MIDEERAALVGVIESLTRQIDELSKGCPYGKIGKHMSVWGTLVDAGLKQGGYQKPYTITYEDAVKWCRTWDERHSAGVGNT